MDCPTASHADAPCSTEETLDGTRSHGRDRNTGKEQRMREEKSKAHERERHLTHGGQFRITTPEKRMGRTTDGERRRSDTL
eukprot:1159044-Pyramimonas_sp.AAC.1